jgi:hypothetical protein
MDGEDERMPTAVGGVLIDFVENAQRLPHLSYNCNHCLSINTIVTQNEDQQVCCYNSFGIIY